MTQIAEPPTFRPAAVPEQPPTEALTASPLTMVQALNHALHDAMAADSVGLVPARLQQRPACGHRNGRDRTVSVGVTTELNRPAWS